MKIVSLLVLSILLVGCGKGGDSKTKVEKKELNQLNDSLSSLGLTVGIGTLTNSFGEHVIVLCEDKVSADITKTNHDRAAALKAYKDSLNGMHEVEFAGGTRTAVWRVEWAIDSAIIKLEGNLSGTTCPEQVLGKVRL